MSETPQQRRDLLYSLLGDLPPRDRPVACDLVKAVETEHYTLETLVLDLNGLEAVPAYFARTRHASGPRPTILYNHAHGGMYEVGKEEFIRHHIAFQEPPYAQQLAELGCNGLCIDHWVFGQRLGRTESSVFKEMLWQGRVMWGMMVFDSLRAVDYLVTRDDVDPGRLGTLGLSMGSTMAWWVAALETRLQVCVDICCLTDFHALIETRGLDGQGVYYYVPRLLKHFTTAQINALIAPRAHLSLAGNYDPLTPPAGLDRIDAELREAYAACGASEAWRLLRYEMGHFETAHMRREIVAFLRKWL